MKTLARELKDLLVNPLTTAFALFVVAVYFLVTGQIVLSFMLLLTSKVFIQGSKLNDLNRRLEEQEEMLDVLLASEDDEERVYAREEII